MKYCYYSFLIMEKGNYWEAACSPHHIKWSFSQDIVTYIILSSSPFPHPLTATTPHCLSPPVLFFPEHLPLSEITLFVYMCLVVAPQKT